MNRGALDGVTPRQFDEREFLQTDARYLVNTLPAYVTPSSLAKPSAWDPATLTYNVLPSNFSNFRLNLAKARAGVSPCNLDFHGDSITEGLTLPTAQTQAFPELVRAMFQSSGEWGSLVYEGGPLNGNGGPGVASGQNDSRLTFSGISTGSGLGAYGIGGWAAMGGNGGGSITFGPITCDTFDVYDRLTGLPAGSGWTWAVDSGSTTFVAQSGSGSGQGNRKTSISAGSYGSHTLSITLTNGFYGVIDGIGVRNPSQTSGGVYFRRCGVGGIAVGQPGGSTAGYISMNVSKELLLTTMTPHLVVLNLGTNPEASGFAASTWQVNITSWVQACQAAGADVLLVTAPPGGNTTTTAQVNYLASIAALAYKVADATNCGVLDWFARWGASATSALDSYFQAGNVHPNAAGHTDIALGVYRALRRIA